MSFSVQHYGQALLYLKIILENMEMCEDYLQIKSLVLILQVLYELKMPNAAKPILDLLAMKGKDHSNLMTLKTSEGLPLVFNQEGGDD